MRWSNTRITKRNLQEMMKRARKNKKSFWRILLTRKLKRLMKSEDHEEGEKVE